MTVYSKEGCAPCATLKYWLTKKQLAYEELPITDYIDDLTSKGFYAAPVVKIGDRYFSGANISAIAQHLGV